MRKNQSTTHDSVVKPIGQSWVDECTRALLESITVGDLFDVAAAELAEHRGFRDDDEESDLATQYAYDVAFFDLLEATVEGLRRSWGGYSGTLKSDQ